MHSKLAPSSAHIWAPKGGCTGWPEMSKLYPEVGRSDAADEGTKAHELGAHILMGGEAPADVDVEMLSNVMVWLNDVNAVVTQGSILGVEERLDLSCIHPEMFGTPDVYVVNGTHLTVWDYKHGFGVVEAFENWQALSYSAGLVAKFPQVETIDIRIAQPRAFHPDGPVRSWTLSSYELEEFRKVIAYSAETALGPFASLQAGNHCRYCPARHACPSMTSAAMWATSTTHEPIKVDVTPEQLGRELSVLEVASKALSYRKSAIEAQIEHHIKQGSIVPGWTIERKPGAAQWKMDSDTTAKTGDVLGVDLRKPQAVMTPAQAIKAGIKADVVKQLSSRPSGKAKLVQVDTNKIKKIFGE